MTAIALMLTVAVQQLPEPFETPWNRAITQYRGAAGKGARLSVPPGFEVNVFAGGLLQRAPNGTSPQTGTSSSLRVDAERSCCCGTLMEMA